MVKKHYLLLLLVLYIFPVQSGKPTVIIHHEPGKIAKAAKLVTSLVVVTIAGVLIWRLYKKYDTQSTSLLPGVVPQNEIPQAGPSHNQVTANNLSSNSKDDATTDAEIKQQQEDIQNSINILTSSISHKDIVGRVSQSYTQKTIDFLISKKALTQEEALDILAMENQPAQAALVQSKVDQLSPEDRRTFHHSSNIVLLEQLEIIKKEQTNTPVATSHSLEQ